VRANALEFLDNLLDGSYKRSVLGLVEGKPAMEQVRQRLHERDMAPHAWPGLLHHQSRHDDDWLSAVALYTVWSSHQSTLYNILADPAVLAGDRKPITRETAGILRERLAM
jgi:hypothetical protein